MKLCLYELLIITIKIMMETVISVWNSVMGYIGFHNSVTDNVFGLYEIWKSRASDVCWYMIIHIIIVLILCSRQYGRMYGRRILPRGPFSLPIVGYYPFLKQNLHVQLYEMSKTYGRIMSFETLGEIRVIVLTGHGMIKEVLVNRADEFSARPKKLHYLTLMDSLGLSQDEGPSWKEQRLFFLQTAKFVGFGKTEMEISFQYYTGIMLEDIKSLNAEPMDIFSYVSYVTLNVTSTFLFKLQFQRNDPKFTNMMNLFKRMFGFFSESKRKFVFGLPLRCFMRLIPSGREALKAAKEVLKIGKDLVEERIKMFNWTEPPSDYIDSFLLQMNKLEDKGQAYKSSFTRRRLESMCVNFLMEGTMTASTVIVAFFEALCLHLDVQVKIQKELDSVIGREKLPSWRDKPQLPYLDAVILELYRLHSPFTLSTFYSNFRRTNIEGYTIPERSIVVANFWSIHNDPAMFPDPQKFDPHRFLDKGGNRLKYRPLYPFGIGKRTCVGESLSQTAVFVIISSVLQHFTLCSTPGDKIKAIPRENFIY